MGWRGWGRLGGCREGRVKDKVSGGGGRGTIFLGIGLGMGIAIGTSSFAVNWRRILH